MGIDPFPCKGRDISVSLHGLEHYPSRCKGGNIIFPPSREEYYLSSFKDGNIFLPPVQGVNITLRQCKGMNILLPLARMEISSFSLKGCKYYLSQYTVHLYPTWRTISVQLRRHYWKVYRTFVEPSQEQGKHEIRKLFVLYLPSRFLPRFPPPPPSVLKNSKLTIDHFPSICGCVFFHLIQI